MVTKMAHILVELMVPLCDMNEEIIIPKPIHK